MCARKGSNGAQENGQRLAGEQRKSCAAYCNIGSSSPTVSPQPQLASTSGPTVHKSSAVSSGGLVANHVLIVLGFLAFEVLNGH